MALVARQMPRTTEETTQMPGPDITESKFFYTRNPFPNRPADFTQRSYAERMDWVMCEIAHGDFSVEKRMGLEEILSVGSFHSSLTPHYFMFKFFLQGFEPEDAAKHVQYDFQARMFFEAFGLERSKPFFTSQLWLHALSLAGLSDPDKATRDGLKLLIKSRGAEHIALVIHDREAGALFAEIFGVKALSLLLPNLAKQVKGQLLEGELGL
jgi:hypothetical protein